jgi:hypothetical protein
MSLHVEEMKEKKNREKKSFFVKNENGTCEKARIMNFKKRNCSKDLILFIIYTITVCVH